MLAQNNHAFPFSSLADYQKVVLASIRDLQQLHDFSQTLKLTKSVELINEIFQQIEANIVTIIGETAEPRRFLTQNRFSELEMALEQLFTQEEHSAIFLQALLNRTLVSGTEILQALNLQECAWQMQQEQFQPTYETSVTTITSLQARKTEELLQIDDASKKVLEQVQPILHRLEYQLKKAAKQVIDSTKIQPKDLKDTKKLTEKLGNQITTEIQKVSDKIAEQIQNEIQRGLMSEIERLQNFAGTIVQTMHHIEKEFFQIGLKYYPETNLGKTLVTTASILTSFQSIFSGYQVAGLSGAALGATGSIGTIAINFVRGFVGVTMTLPIMITIGVLSIFTTNWLVDKLLGSFRVEKFKEDYKTKVIKEINKQFKMHLIVQQVNHQISSIFSTLKQQVEQELEALLDNTQKTLVELQSKREQDETFTERECQQLHDIRTETQRIFENAQQLSEQLV